MCGRTLRPTKEKRREGAPSIRFFFVGGRVRLHVAIRIVLSCFYLLIFYFDKVKLHKMVAKG